MQRIFVGDVQGCADELDELLARARTEFGDGFELWLVGDLVNRGPHNLRPLRVVRELVEAGRARYVLGNHEIGLIATALGVRPLSEFDSFVDVLDAPDRDDWVAWLCGRELVARGALGEQEFAMVHAASHPDWSLADLCDRARSAEAQLRAGPERVARWLSGADFARESFDTLGRVTNCRSVRSDGTWSSEVPAPEHGTVAWHASWSQARHDFGIVYGHWALQGLHVEPLLRGLDTGCVHHGRGRDGSLTAWLPDPAATRPFDSTDVCLWKVPARRAYYAHRDA